MYFKKLLQQRYVRLIALGLFIFISLAFIVFFNYARPKAGPSIVGKDDGTLLVDYAGKSVRFDQFTSVFSRKPLIIFFWATWCPYCNTEFASLANLTQQYGNKIEIVAVNRGESSVDAKKYTDALNLGETMVFLIDRDDALFKKLGGYAMPEMIFINSHGEEVFHKHGPISNEEIETAAIKATQ